MCIRLYKYTITASKYTMKVNPLLHRVLPILHLVQLHIQIYPLTTTYKLAQPHTNSHTRTPLEMRST